MNTGKDPSFAPASHVGSRTSAFEARARDGAILDTMTSPAHRVRYSWADYVALEASSNVKHELLDGQIYAMARGTPEHAALAASVDGSCSVSCEGEGVALTTQTSACACSRRGSRRIPTSPSCADREREVEVWTRDDAGAWTSTVARDGESARLD